MKFPVRIAVLSDLHIGDLARSPDLKPGYAGGALEDGPFLRKFRELASTLPEIDYMVLAGDITSFAGAHEFLHAEDVIRALAAILQVNMDHVIAVPGNHDVSWDVSKLYDGTPATEMWLSELFKPMMRPHGVFEKLCSSGASSLAAKPYFVVKEDAGAVFIALNTASRDLHDAKPHHGSFDLNDIAALKARIQPLADDERLKVAVFHHHCFQYPEVDRRLHDHSAMMNAEPLLDALADARVDVIVHGHKHVPNFAVHGRYGAIPMAMLCAGSFSVKLPSEFTGSIANHFHLIDVKERSAGTGRVKGVVYSWAYGEFAGWKKSDREYTGVSPAHAFGDYLNLHVIKPQTLVVAVERIKENGYVRWSQLASDIDGLAYLPEPLKAEILTAIEEKLDAEAHPLANNDHIILPRGGVPA